MKISKQAIDATNKIATWQNQRISGEFHIRDEVATQMLKEDIQKACELYHRAKMAERKTAAQFLF